MRVPISTVPLLRLFTLPQRAHSGPAAPPSPPAFPSFCNGAFDPVLPGDRCFVNVFSHHQCTNPEHVGRTCFTIDRKFHFAFVSGKCYDPDGNLVGTSCFDIPTATSDVISYYPSAYGFTLSTAMKGHPDFSTMYWEIAPPLTPGGDFVLPLMQNYTFALTLDASQTQIFESSISMYTVNVGISPPPSPPPFAPKAFAVDVRLGVSDGDTAASLSAEQIVASAGSLTADSDASSSVTVTQTWEVGFTVGPGEDPAELAARLVAACQATSADCTLETGRRRRQLQSVAGTSSVVLARPLTNGSLAAEIPALNSTGVAVTNASFQGVDVVVSVTQRGGTEEAEALLNGSLAAEQVRSAVAADLSLGDDALSVEVQRPIFPPMPPPMLPPSPPSPPPSPPPKPPTPPTIT